MEDFGSTTPEEHSLSSDLEDDPQVPSDLEDRPRKRTKVKAPEQWELRLSPDTPPPEAPPLPPPESPLQPPSRNFQTFRFDLSTCARPNILALKPYRCARDDYKDQNGNVLLDANENSYGPCVKFNDQNGEAEPGSPDKTLDVDSLKLNRYPDPQHSELKELLCRFRNTGHHTHLKLRPRHLVLGVGSDEIVDGVIRCFCTPGRDKILTCPPTYGMYAVSAQINDVENIKVPLDTENQFSLRPEAINEALSSDPSIKLVFICSPGNPTGFLISRSAIQQVLEHPTWNGVVVVDEAYVDFAAEGSSLAQWVTEWPNLVVMQTLSKAFGLAGIRLGMAFTSPDIATLLNNIKAPYNISTLTGEIAKAALQQSALVKMRSNRDKIFVEREKLLACLETVPRIGNKPIGGLDTNFVLVQVLGDHALRGGMPSNRSAYTIYEALAEEKGIIVRFRGEELGCYSCLRITVGMPDENNRLEACMRKLFPTIATCKDWPGYRDYDIESSFPLNREECQKRTRRRIKLGYASAGEDEDEEL